MPHTELLDTLQHGSQLSKTEMKRCMDAIIDGSIPDEAIARILTLLQENGISADEIAGARESLLEKATPLNLMTGLLIHAAQEATTQEPTIFPPQQPSLQMPPASA